MPKKRIPKILSNEMEDEIREIVRDEMKKTTKTDMKMLLESLDEIVSKKLKTHLISLSAFITSRFGKEDG